jgi:hypothetical protein
VSDARTVECGVSGRRGSNPTLSLGSRPRTAWLAGFRVTMPKTRRACGLGYATIWYSPLRRPTRSTPSIFATCVKNVAKAFLRWPAATTSSIPWGALIRSSCKSVGFGARPSLCTPRPAGLQDNGGPTKTVALQSGSPAIDAAVAANCPPTDQRGVSRPQGAGCDIGAFELVTNRPPNCASVIASPNRLWPPNHRLVLIALAGATDPDGDTVTLTVTGATQDEPVSGLGPGDVAPDAQAGTQSNTVFVRAERADTGDGRVYRVSFTGSDGKGGSCSGTVKVSVPKTQRSTAVDSAPPS